MSIQASIPSQSSATIQGHTEHVIVTEQTTKPSREERKAAKKAAKKAERKALKAAAAKEAKELEMGQTTVVKTIEHHTSSENVVGHHVEAHHTSSEHAIAHHAAIHHSSEHVAAHHVSSHHISGEHIATQHVAAHHVSERVLSDEEEGNFIVTTKQHFADRIVAIPEIVQREVNEEAYVSVPRKVVEREKVIVVKEVVEIPEIEYVDEYVTEEYIQDVHRTIEKPVTVEKEVEHIVHVDDIETVVVEVPEVTYDDVVVVKDVPVPNIIEKEKIVEKVVPQIKEEIIEDVNYIYQDREVRRNIPVPVEATIKQKFIAPRIHPVSKDRTYKVLLPEFSEHAVWASSITPEGHAALPSFNDRINQLAGSSLCEVEKLFCDIKATKLESDDWLNSEMLKGRMNLPYMGVEKVHINEPTFLQTMEEASKLIHPQHSMTEQQVKGKFMFCKPKKRETQPQATIIRSTQPQFVTVDSHLGHTTISPTANYAKRTTPIVSQH